MLAQAVPRAGGEATRAPWIALGTRMLLPWVALALIALCACATEAWAARPNDPLFPLQWGDSNTGQSVPTQNAKEELGSSQKGAPGADDRALSAWGPVFRCGEFLTGRAAPEPGQAGGVTATA